MAGRMKCEARRSADSTANLLDAVMLPTVEVQIPPAVVVSAFLLPTVKVQIPAIVLSTRYVGFVLGLPGLGVAFRWPGIAFRWRDASEPAPFINQRFCEISRQVQDPMVYPRMAPKIIGDALPV